MAVYRKIKSFTFRDYVVFGELGTGVTGKVYLARRGQDPTLVALKLLHHDADALVRDLFFNEQRLLRKADHRHVVQYIDGGSEPQHAYLATRYVEGTRLDQLLGAPLPPAAVVRIIEQASAAIDYLHGRHPDHPIIHCDVAPRNIVVDDQGNAVLLDLSSAHTSFFIPAEDASLLSPGYCAPEQMHHQPTPSSDQYALAVIAFELLTGTRLYPKEKRADAQHDHPPILPRMRSTMQRAAEVLLRAQQRLPDARFPSCGAFAAQLERALCDDLQFDDSTPGVVMAHLTRHQHRVRRGGTRQSLILAVVVALAASGLLMAGGPNWPPVIQAENRTNSALAPTATIATREPIAKAQRTLAAELIPTATLAAMIVPIEAETPTAVPSAVPRAVSTVLPTVIPTPRTTTRLRATATRTPSALPTVRTRTPVPAQATVAAQPSATPVPEPTASATPAPEPTPAGPRMPVPEPTPAGPRMPVLRGFGENQAKALLTGLGIPSAQIQVQYQSRSVLGGLFDQIPPYVVVSSLPGPGAPISSSTFVILGIRSEHDDAPPTIPAVDPNVSDAQPQP